MPKPTKNPKRDKPISEDELRRRHERFVLVFEAVSSFATKLLYCVTGIVFSYVTFYLPVTVAPGKTTVVQNLTQFVSNIHANVWVAWGVAAGASFLARRERKLRFDERKVKDERIRTLEKQIDPNVTSSKMNVEGSDVTGE